MSNFHINPKSGEPGRCSAKEEDRCPFKDVSEHFDTVEAARAGYEKEMEARQKYEDLQNLSKDLIDTTLALRSVMDERMKHKASDPEWGEIKNRVAAAKGAHQEVLLRVSREGLNARDLILGVDDSGNIFNKDQLYRVRPYAPEEYAKMAGVPVRVGSDIPMPGDAAIAWNNARWESDRAELESLPQGSPERKAARTALVKRVVRETPYKNSLLALKTDLSESDQLQVLRGRAVHQVMEMHRSAGISSETEAGVFAARSLKAAQKFLDELK